MIFESHIGIGDWQKPQQLVDAGAERKLQEMHRSLQQNSGKTFPGQAQAPSPKS